MTAAALLLFGMLPSAAPMSQLADHARPVPNCGPASVFAILKLLGQPHSVADVEQRMRDLNPQVDLDRASMADLRRCLESFGLHAASLRFSRNTAATAPTPAILYVTWPDAEEIPETGRPLGHFMVLRKIDQEQAEILDLHPLARAANYTMPTAELLDVWDGTLLAVSSQPIHVERDSWSGALTVSLWASTIAVVGILSLLLRELRWSGHFPSAKNAA